MNIEYIEIQLICTLHTNNFGFGNIAPRHIIEHIYTEYRNISAN